MPFLKHHFCSCEMSMVSKSNLNVSLLTSVSQPFLPRATLGHQYHSLAAPLDAKMGL